MLQTSGIREPLRVNVKTTTMSDDVEEDESDVEEHCVELETGTEQAQDCSSSAESSLSSNVLINEHTSNSRVQVATSTPCTGPVALGLHEHNTNQMAVCDVKTDTGTVEVCQSSDSVLPAVAINIPLSCSSDVKLSNIGMPAAASLVDFSGLLASSVTQPVVVQQYSRPSVTVLVDSNSRRIMVSTARKPTEEMSAAPITGCHSNQTVQGFLQPQQAVENLHLRDGVQADPVPRAAVASATKPLMSLARKTGPETVVPTAESFQLRDVVQANTVPRAAVASATRPLLSGPEMWHVIEGGDEMRQYLTSAIGPHYSVPQSLQQQEHR